MRTMHVSMLEFLQTGKLCGLRLGLARQLVNEEFGPPDAFGGTSRKYRTPLAYRYGEVEVHFHPQHPHPCTMIHIERPANGAPISFHKSCALSGWNNSFGSSIAETREFLQENNVQFIEIASTVSIASHIYIPSSFVGIGFDDADKLWSFSVAEMSMPARNG